MCWIDDRTLAIWGFGTDDLWLIPAVRLFDVVSGEELRWFAGPEVMQREVSPREGMKRRQREDSLIFDEHLFSISHEKGVQVWDVATSEQLLTDPSFIPRRYHQGTKEFLTILPEGRIQLSRLVDDKAK